MKAAFYKMIQKFIQEVGRVYEEVVVRCRGQWEVLFSLEILPSESHMLKILG
jgi:hypothetical protein